MDGRSVNAQHHFNVLAGQRHIAQRGIVHEIFQIRQAPCHGINVFWRNGCCFRKKGLGQGIGQNFDFSVLTGTVHTQQGQTLTQTCQQTRQALNDLRTVAAVGLGTGGPHQIRGGTFVRHSVRVLGAIAHGRKRQHLGPGFEEKFADFIAHRHIFEQTAQLNGVLNGQGFALLNLLSHTHQARRGLALGQVLGQEFFKFFVHELKHPLAGFRILLNHLHDAPHLGFQRTTVARSGIEAHHTGPHAVNQAARGVVKVAEKLRLGQSHAQHRHLQTCKPYAHSRGNAILGQDALEHQRHHLNGGFFAGRRGFLFQGVGLLAYLPCHLHHNLRRHHLGSRHHGHATVQSAGQHVLLHQRLRQGLRDRGCHGRPRRHPRITPPNQGRRDQSRHGHRRTRRALRHHRHT